VGGGAPGGEKTAARGWILSSAAAGFRFSAPHRGRYNDGMNTTFLTRCALLAVLAICLASLGCHLDEDASPQKSNPVEPGKTTTKKIAFGKGVTLEIEGDKRRVLVDATVCWQKSPLEQLVCRKGTKEHEAVFSADVDARHIHTALLAAGATAGSPVKFQPKLTAPSGTVIKVTVRYTDRGQVVTAPGQQFVRSVKTKKPLEHDWVFAGSQLLPDPFDKTKPPAYMANLDGDLICVANFEGAMLDLGVLSSKDNDDLAYEGNPDRIPALGAAAVLILEPVLPPKKK
jgi:hypothetical protein